MRKWLVLTALLCAAPAQAQMTLTDVGTGGVGGGAPPGAMVTPLMFTAASNPGTGAINYVPITGSNGNNLYTATASTKPEVMAVAGTIANLQVYFNPTPAITQGSYDVGLAIAGTKQLLTCTLGSTPFTQSCSDNTHSVSISPGQQLSWFTCPSATATCTNAATTPGIPTAQTVPIQISATFTSAIGQESPLSAGGLAVGYNATAINYAGFGGHGAWSATENLVSTVLPAAGTIDTLQVAASATIIAGTLDVTLVKNGTDTALTCQISTLTSFLTCSTANGVNPITVAQFDTISIKTCPSNVATCPAGAVPTARGLSVGVRWVPSTTGQAVIMNSEGTVQATSTTVVWTPVSGQGTAPGTTENAQTSLVPLIPAGKTFSINNLTTSQCPGPGAAATKVVTLRKGASGGALSSQSLTSTVAIGTTACPTATTSSGSGAVTAVAGDVLAWQFANSATNTALTFFKLAATVNIQ